MLDIKRFVAGIIRTLHDSDIVDRLDLAVTPVADEDGVTIVVSKSEAYPILAEIRYDFGEKHITVINDGLDDWLFSDVQLILDAITTELIKQGYDDIEIEYDYVDKNFIVKF